MPVRTVIPSAGAARNPTGAVAAAINGGRRKGARGAGAQGPRPPIQRGDAEAQRGLCPQPNPIPERGGAEPPTRPFQRRDAEAQRRREELQFSHAEALPRNAAGESRHNGATSERRPRREATPRRTTRTSQVGTRSRAGQALEWASPTENRRHCGQIGPRSSEVVRYPGQGGVAATKVGAASP